MKKKLESLWKIPIRLVNGSFNKTSYIIFNAFQEVFFNCDPANMLVN
jgi:hypothetical protein